MIRWSTLAAAFASVFLLVLALQPAYFAAMTNLNRLVSHNATWQHVRDAFDSGVLAVGSRSKNQFINGGDRFTDCYSLGLGLEPDVSDAVAGITASRPVSDRHACDDLKDAAENPHTVVWNRYARYWHGYRLYSAPIASALPILALKLINFGLLIAVTAFFVRQGANLVGAAAMFGLCAPVLFCTDYVRIWHVTPHTVSTAIIVGGAGIFAIAIRHQVSAFWLVVLSGLVGSVFNFVDFLVNPPWMPALIAFLIMAGLREATARERAAVALACVSAWFAAYGLTWFAKWIAAYIVDPSFDIKADVISTAAFRISGDNSKVVHFPAVATLKMLAAIIATWGVPLFIAFAAVAHRAIKERTLDRATFLWLAWPALIPVAWFELLSNHSQIHAPFVARSAAVSVGIILASALIAANVTTDMLAAGARRMLRRAQPRSA